MKKRYSEAYEIIDDLILPEVVRGRPPLDDTQWIDAAREGRRSGRFRSRNHAARELSKDAKGASPDANQKRFNIKFKNAGID
jgi:hypothetical protein